MYNVDAYILVVEIPEVTSPPVVSNSNRCPECGTIKKSGKHSCCARGGAWFKKCGDVEDKQFDHTWAEGIQACKSFARSNSVTQSLEAMFRHVEVNNYPVETVKPRIINQHQQNISRVSSLSSTGAMDYNDCGGLGKIVVCIFVTVILRKLT